nr:uncharacterized protein C12orf40 homolog isoform X6 [Macaca fascicularis]
MNWVGGSRSRVLIKQERRKQKEYFEKHRLKSKMKSLGVLSPVKNSAVSLDILNLYMINQISCKKKIPETVRKPTHVNMNRGIKMPLRKHNLELPISPHCVPSKLCLDDTETNINYQRLSSKEDLGPVQSQGMDSYSTLDPQFSKIENCSFTPTSFSVELASNRHISKLNFTPGIAPTPQKLAYEKKQNDQLSNVNCSDSLLSKLNKSQDVLSPSHKTTQFGTLFERLNRSLGNRNLLTKCPTVIMDEDCRSMDEIGQSDYITEKHSIQHIWRKNGKKVSNFLEGKLENDYQERTPQKSIQKYPANSMGNIPSEELHYKQSWDFGLDEILMEEGGICSLKSRPTSTEKISLDSAQSSWSTSYSPRPTDSCFSSSSDVPSEDEDQISQHIEDSNRMPIKTKEKTNNFYVEGMAKVSGDRIVKNNDKIHKQNENFYQFSVKNNTDQFPQSQCNSAHILQNKTSDNCILQPARCDAGVQTESESVMEEKLDAAIQCDLISKCTCRSDVSLCNLERCSENIKTDTTGGQEILKNN